VIGTAEQLAAIVPVLERVLQLEVRQPDRPSDRTEGNRLFYADILEIRADQDQ